MKFIINTLWNKNTYFKKNTDFLKEWKLLEHLFMIIDKTEVVIFHAIQKFLTFYIQFFYSMIVIGKESLKIHPQNIDYSFNRLRVNWTVNWSLADFLEFIYWNTIPMHGNDRIIEAWNAWKISKRRKMNHKWRRWHCNAHKYFKKKKE